MATSSAVYLKVAYVNDQATKEKVIFEINISRCEWKKMSKIWTLH